VHVERNRVVRLGLALGSRARLALAPQANLAPHGVASKAFFTMLISTRPSSTGSVTNSTPGQRSSTVKVRCGWRCVSAKHALQIGEQRGGRDRDAPGRSVPCSASSSVRCNWISVQAGRPGD